MLRSRIIPTLLLSNKGLCKTTKFSDPKYVGDPINAVKIFNEKEADELIFLDIDCTSQNKEPDYDLISIIASASRMPICYGGGIRNFEQIKKIISLGVEKISISSSFFNDPNLLYKSAEKFGNQSIVLTLDIKKCGLFQKKYGVFTHNGMKQQKFDFEKVLPKLSDYGVGELCINSIERDGTMIGYDLELIKYIRDKINIPLTVIGGASSYSNIKELVKTYNPIGASAGSIFVFKGKYRAVLIQYPDDSQKKDICCFKEY